MKNQGIRQKTSILYTKIVSNRKYLLTVKGTKMKISCNLVTKLM